MVARSFQNTMGTFRVEFNFTQSIFIAAIQVDAMGKTFCFSNGIFPYDKVVVKA